MKKSLSLALLLIGMVAPVFAQQMPPGKWWRKPEVVRQLSLAREQQDKLESIYRDAADQLIDLRGEVEKRNIDLRAALDRDQLNKADIQKLATRASDARGRLFERELMMLVDMRSVLNPEQWETMRGMLQSREDRGPGMQRGMPGRGAPRAGRPGDRPGQPAPAPPPPQNP